MSFLPYEVIKGRRDARLLVSGEQVFLREWSISLGARVGIEPEETTSFLSMKLKCGMKLAKDFEHGKLEKHQLLLISAMKDHFCNPKAVARDGSTAFDRRGLLIIDIDKRIPGYEFWEMKRELQTFLRYPVAVSPSGNLKIIIPIAIMKNSPWNYETKMAVIGEFLNQYLPEDLGKPYLGVVDRSPTSSKVFFANEAILNTLLEYPLPLNPLILEPASEKYDLFPRSGKIVKDRTNWIIPDTDPELIRVLANVILSSAPAKKTISPKFLELKIQEYEKDSKSQEWVEKYIEYVKERMGKLVMEVQLTQEQKVRARLYGKTFFTRLADYAMLVRIMLSQPAVDDGRSLRFFQEILDSRGVGFEKNYIHRLFKELESLRLIEKTRGMVRHKSPNSYKLSELLEVFFDKARPVRTREIELPQVIPDGCWNETLWKCSPRFQTFESFFGWAASLPRFSEKKDRVYHIFSAWNSSIKKDMKTNRLRGRESVLVRLGKDGEIIKQVLQASA